MPEKEKIELEFLLNASSKILYNCLITPSGLSEWFADDVNINQNRYTFIWNNDEESANLISKRKEEYVRFQWEYDEDEDYFFEFRIKTDPITGDTALIITDYVDADEVEENEQLWEKQVTKLKRILGV